MEGSPTGDGSTSSGEARRRPDNGVAPDRTGPSVCYVVHNRGSDEIRFDRESVEQLLAGGDFFWLDLDQPSVGDFQILRDVFRFHPLACGVQIFGPHSRNPQFAGRTLIFGTPQGFKTTARLENEAFLSVNLSLKPFRKRDTPLARETMRIRAERSLNSA